MKTVALKDAVPMSDAQCKVLINLVMVEHADPKNMHKILDQMEKDNFFPYMIYKKRMDVLKLPLNMTPGAVVFMIGMGDRPGHVTCMMVDCMEYQEESGKSEVTLEDMTTDLYPFGFYNEEAFGRRIDQIQERKNKWDFIY